MVLERRPLVCVVTDRRRWAGLPEATALARLDTLVQSAVDAGLALVQVRERDMEAGALYHLVRRLVAYAASSPSAIVVNDRVDVAAAAGAAGAHLRASSVPTARVRAMVSADTLVGRSAHSSEDARVAGSEGASYVCFGTVFPSVSKPLTHRVAGIEALGRAVESCTVPVLAIGGVTIDRLGQVAEAGAAGFAAIDMFSGGSGSEYFEPARAIGDILDAAARHRWR